jgi:signal peptidase II
MPRPIANLVIFAVVAALVGLADLTTKDWAARNLASDEHVVPLEAGESDQGKTLAEFIAQTGFPEALPDDLALLEKPLDTAADGLFPTARITKDRGYFVFLTEARDSPPLFLLNPALREYAELKKTGRSKEEWKASWKERKLPFKELLAEEFPFLDDDEAAEILAQRLVHPVPSLATPLSRELRLSGGETFLLKNRTITLIPGLLRFIYVENTGAAWGFLREAHLYVKVFFLQIVTGFAMIVILVLAWRARKDRWWTMVALAGIMGGAVGNFVERIGRSAVVDFIDMYVKEAHWPTYNVADIGITLGVIVLALQVFRKKGPF